MIYQVLVAFITVFFIAIVLKAPKKALFYNALSGLLSYFVYLITLEHANKILAVLFAASVVALCAHIFSRILKIPTTVFLLPPLYLYVPGSLIYRAVYSLIINNVADFNHYLYQTLLTAGAIALAVFGMDSIFIIISNLKKKTS